jgi:hypothetical protein
MSIRSLTLDPHFLTESLLSLQGLVHAVLETYQRNIAPPTKALSTQRPLCFRTLHQRLEQASILTTREAASVYYVAVSTMTYTQSQRLDEGSGDSKQVAQFWFDLTAWAYDLSNQARALLPAESLTLIHQLIELELRLDQLRLLNHNQPIPPLAQNSTRTSSRRQEMRDLFRSTEADWVKRAEELCTLCRIRPAALLSTILPARSAD